MRKHLLTRLLLATLLALISNIPIYAKSFRVGDFDYNVLSEDDCTCEVHHYYGNDGDITIPSSVSNGSKTYSVTAIGDFAFENQYNKLKSVNIPSSVNTIGVGAFANCTGLKSVKIPSAVLVHSAFSNCTSLTSVTIEDGCTAIGDFTFAGCTALSSIKIPNSVKKIGAFAFSGCKSLSSITIPDCVTELHVAVFEDCSNLKSVVIGEGIKEIGNQTFNRCVSLESVTIGSNVYAIYRRAFGSCSSLEAIEIPRNVEIMDEPFDGCENLKTIYLMSYDVPRGCVGEVSPECTIYVPVSLYYGYKYDNLWNKYNIVRYREPGEIVDVDCITFEENKITVVEGETKVLRYEIVPDDATDMSITWTSSDETVATVSADGVVTAVGVGTATITAAAHTGRHGTCVVTVTENIDKKVEQFTTDNADILAKTADNVTADDIEAIEKAIAAYNALSSEAQARLINVKTLLDAMKIAAEQDKADKEAEAAIVAEVNAFNESNADILAKTADSATADDIEAIEKAIAEYNALSVEAQSRLSSAKTLLDAMKIAAEQDKADKEAEAAIVAEVNAFNESNAAILAKTADNVTVDDLDAIEKAIAEYYALSVEAQSRLSSAKAQLDAMKVAAEQDKADKEAEAAIVAEVNAFNESNADILAKTADSATADDIEAIEKAIAEYNALSVEAQSRLSSAKTLLDAMKIAAEQDKADKEAEAAIVAEVNAFNESNADILAKTADNVTADDLDAIDKAIAEYNALSVEAQSRLSSAKAQLDAMKVAAEQDKADKEAEAAIVAEVNAFNESNADILAKTTANVTVDDLDAIDKAIAEYYALSSAAQARLINVKALLDAMKIAAEQDKANKEAEAAIIAEVNAFNESNADILAKTADNVTVDDLDAIDKAIAEYNALSSEAQARLINVKTLLDAMKIAAEQDKADKEAEAAIVAEVNAFNESNADILAKTADNVTVDDLDAIEKAIAEYNALSVEAQSRLSSAKALLDAMKVAAEKDKADKEAEAAIVAEVNAFNESNADILAKTTANVTVDDLDAIEKAIAEYNALSSEAQARLINVKTLLDAMKIAAEQDKADKEAEAAIVAEVNAFNESNANILAKTADNVTVDDLDAIDKAIAAYNALSAEAQSRLSSAKAQLDAMKVAAEQDKADKEAEAAIAAEVNAFNESNADILAKTTANVTVDDLDAIEKAIAEYNALSAEAQSRLSSAKALLDMLKSKIDDLASGIASVTIDCAADEVYTLNGVRVRSIVKRGMYIVNGKKVLIK